MDPMADNNAPDNELDTTTEQIPDDGELNDHDNDDDSDDQGNGDSGDNGDSDDDSEHSFFFGDDELDSPASEESKDPALVKHLRGTIKEKERELKELRRQSQQPVQQQAVITQQPRMPKLEDDDIGFDEVVYQDRMNKWVEDNSKYQEQERTRTRQAQEFQERHQQKLTNYQERVKALKVPNYQAAEQLVLDDIPVNTQAMIIHSAEKPEMVVLALGRNAELRQQMAEATDPVAIGRLIGTIESKARIMPKAKNKTSTVPEVKGSNGAALNNLDKLLEKARTTGDYSEYRAAKRKAK